MSSTKAFEDSDKKMRLFLSLALLFGCFSVDDTFSNVNSEM